jgi:hypothetical protein
MGVGGQRHAPAALLPGKTRYPLYRRLGGLVWTGAESLAPNWIRSQDCPARSEWLYRLSYPGHRNNGVSDLNYGFEQQEAQASMENKSCGDAGKRMAEDRIEWEEHMRKLPTAGD